MRKVLISGIPPGPVGGVAYLMEKLVQLAKAHNWEVVFPAHSEKQLRKVFYNPFIVLPELLKRYLNKKKYLAQIAKINNAEIILIHPQTIGFTNFFRLIENNTIVKLYIMDNSFFCVKSYNFLESKECFKCLGGVGEAKVECRPHPVSYSLNDNLRYLKYFQELSCKVVFYAQNQSQAKLLHEHFGQNIKCKIIGLCTDEFEEVRTVDTGSGSFDIVYHGNHLDIKGVYFVIELAMYLNEFSILIPCSKQAVHFEADLPSNITFKEIDWNSGLRDFLVHSKLVLNPSLWSAPIEGALLKSIYYNGNVGVVETKYGFINEIPDDCLLKLSPDPKQASNQVRLFFTSDHDFSQKSKNWLRVFFEHDCKLDELFD